MGGSLTSRVVVFPFLVGGVVMMCFVVASVFWPWNVWDLCCFSGVWGASRQLACLRHLPKSNNLGREGLGYFSSSRRRWISMFFFLEGGGWKVWRLTAFDFCSWPKNVAQKRAESKVSNFESNEFNFGKTGMFHWLLVFFSSAPGVTTFFWRGGTGEVTCCWKRQITKGHHPNDQAMADRLDLGPGSKVLDVGCGRGRVAHHMASYSGAHVTGINIDHSQVKMAKESLARKVEDEFFCFCLFVFLNFRVFFFWVGGGGDFEGCKCCQKFQPTFFFLKFENPHHSTNPPPH